MVSSKRKSLRLRGDTVGHGILISTGGNCKVQSDTNSQISIVVPLQRIPQVQSQPHPKLDFHHRHLTRSNCKQYHALQFSLKSNILCAKNRFRTMTALQLILIVQLLLVRSSMADDRFRQLHSQDGSNKEVSRIESPADYLDLLKEDENVVPPPASPPSISSRESYRLHMLNSGRRISTRANSKRARVTAKPKIVKDDPRKITKTPVETKKPKVDPPDKGGDKGGGGKKPPTIRPTSLPTIKPTEKPTEEPQGSPSSAPSFYPSMEPTTSKPTVTPGNPTPAPITWQEREKAGQVRLEFSLLVRDETLVEGSGSVAYLTTPNSGHSRNNTRRNTVNGDGLIDAEDIYSGKESQLLHDVLTTMMHVICNTNYMVLSSASAVNEAAEGYVNYCKPGEPNMKPGTMYDKRFTVLLIDMTGGKENLELNDRAIFAGGQKELEMWKWLEWDVIIDVLEPGSKLVRANDGNVDTTIEVISNVTNEAMKEGWSEFDDTLTSMNNHIIATSPVGEELVLFNDAIQRLREIEANKTRGGTNNTVSEINIAIVKATISKWGFFSPIRLFGFGMLCCLGALTYILTNQASKRYQHQSWDATFMGDLETEEGVEKMLCSGRQNVDTNKNITENETEEERTQASSYMPSQYTSNRI